MKQKALIVDDEVSIVTLLSFNLKKAGFETDVAYDGAEAMKKVEKNVYDIILLDLMLPEIDGLEVCRQLRKKQIDTPIIMLTARNEEFNKILGLELGADDYLTKPFSPKEVVARIKAILRRTNKSAINVHSTIHIGNLMIDPNSYEVKLADKTILFTRKEFELLLHLANHLGNVLSRDQLLSEVWNYDFAGDTRIVDVHISRLRDKIEPNTKKPVYIKTIRGLGYKMEDPTA
ncbi:response regulator transcription factor [Virgibacillus alimentarius]|uniref:Two-component system alkaline phosphatase synthesis response regulator PhoP n=1 Tax=Virgibacillus alimentarius TaxID=698769 RepID=A0ABS4SAP7_9BACI|nr:MULTISPECIES: response regulator transcription factor [Virgibacillus]MBP2258570.1 two-component system alkaline phosphatase synthesis response regulator PhoP [Virgibacillus alimentarius]HLR68437.1 response regulator transcription factor [Virgibacillus sp.]